MLKAHYVKTSVTRQQGEAYFKLLDELESFMALPAFYPSKDRAMEGNS